MTFHIYNNNNSFEKAKKDKKDKKGLVRVKDYTKQNGWGGEENRLRHYSNAEEFTTGMAQKYNKGDTHKDIPIEHHNRKKPNPSSDEAKQKSLNNKAAYEGKNYRFEVKNGKPTKVSLEKRFKEQARKRYKAGCTAPSNPGKAYKYLSPSKKRAITSQVIKEEKEKEKEKKK